MAIGKVIKSDAPVPEGSLERPAARARSGVVNAEDYEAGQQAKAILEAAHRTAAEILAAAETQKAEIFQKARDEGFQDGLRQTTETLARAKMAKGELLKSAAPDIVALALKVAEKIIGADLERDPNLVAQICATATEATRTAKAMVVRVHPKSGAILRGAGKLSELLAKNLDVTIRDDAEVELGGCIIQTEFGTIDAQLHTQFQMLRNVLLPEPGKSEGPA